jgi:hypothetical protein
MAARWKNFDEARAFVRGLDLKTQREWADYCKSDKRPPDIPYEPHVVYANEGWSGLGDWLGPGRVANKDRQYRPFAAAREFVRGLGLKSREDWSAYAKSGKRPADIPAYPEGVYANEGWSGVGDWLGTGRVATNDRQYRLSVPKTPSI